MSDSQSATPAFSVRMRGYDQREVDDFLRQLTASPELAVPAFTQRMRGYSIEQVDDYIAFLKRRSQHLPESTGRGEFVGRHDSPETQIILIGTSPAISTYARREHRTNGG